MSGFETWKRVTERETAQESDDSSLPSVNALTLNSPAPLATNCVLIGHCDKADVVWTGTEFRTLTLLRLQNRYLAFRLGKTIKRKRDTLAKYLRKRNLFE